MTLSIKSRYDEKKLVDKKLHNKIGATAAILIILVGCFWSRYSRRNFYDV
jgi:hypothetical protein